MPLDLSSLKEDLQALFESPGPTAAACAASWADAMKAYAAAIVPPSLTVNAAAASLASALTGAFTSGPATVANVEAAFAAFAVSVAGGMAPAYTGAPPVGPVGFAVEFAKPPASWPTTHAAAANAWGNKIHAWMTTGKATLVAPPNPIVPWS